MKKLFSVILSIIFLLSTMANLAFATEAENQISNIAPQGVSYSSSEKNSLWTPVKNINDGVLGQDTWEGWECAYPTVQKGQDTSKGFSGEYCGIDFDDKFFEVSSVKLSLGIHRLLGGQNMKYELKALVEGKWQTVATFMDSDTTPHNTEKHPTYEDVIADESAGHRTLADYEITLNESVSSNNFRLCVSEFGKNYEGGDVQVFPYIYELELYGKEAEAPDIILPEGATATTNIAWYSYPKASSSMKNHYPFLAIDENDETYWSPSDDDGAPSYTLVFDKEYSINKLTLIFKNEVADLEIIFVSGDSEKAEDCVGDISKQGENTCISYELEEENVTGVRVEFNGSERIELIALEAHMSRSRTYYLDKRFEASQISSASNGNIAIIGKPYASSSFTPYSNVKYINDGLKDDKQWFTGTINVPEYCGLTFDYPQKISRAVITVKSIYIYGIEAMSFEIQALVDGNYVKVAEGKSYNSESGYTTEYVFDEIETTDIRVVITQMGGAIPNITELELFNSENSIIPMFNGVEKTVIEDCGTTNNQIIDNHICEIDESNAIVLAVVGLSAITVAVVAVVAFVIIKKKNKEV